MCCVRLVRPRSSRVHPPISTSDHNVDPCDTEVGTIKGRALGISALGSYEQGGLGREGEEKNSGKRMRGRWEEGGEKAALDRDLARSLLTSSQQLSTSTYREQSILIGID